MWLANYIIYTHPVDSLVVCGYMNTFTLMVACDAYNNNNNYSGLL